MARTVEQCRQLDVNWCNDEGVLAPGSGTITWHSDDEENSIGYHFRSLREKDILELHYVRYNKYLDDEPQNVHCIVSIDYTECHFGGERPWFRCPRCHDRVGKLYSTTRSDEFICRDCGDLIYRSQEYTTDFIEALRAEREARASLEANPFDRDALRNVYETHKEGRRAMLEYLQGLDERYGEETSNPLRKTIITPDEMSPFEEWADRLFHRAAESSPEGRAYGYHGRCMATAKTTGDRCRQPARGDHGKCYYHGGAEGSGIGEGQTDHAAEAIREALEKQQTFNAQLAIREKSHIR